MKRFVHVEDIQRRIFAAMLAHLDDSVGRVVDALRESSLEDKTLIVFLSDNGGPTRELTSSNAPLRGGKGDLWEGGIRVPFIVSWKNQVPVGRVIDTPITSMDVTAASLELAGTASGDAQIDGFNFLPWLIGKKNEPSDRTLFWRVGQKHALRRGDWKLIRDGNQWQLYNIAQDIRETTDLAAEQPARVQQLSILWDKWNAEQIEPRWR